MFICNDCRSEFSEPKVIQECRGEYWGAPAYEDIGICPVCGSDDIAEEDEEYEEEDEEYTGPECIVEIWTGDEWEEIAFEDLECDDIFRMSTGGEVTTNNTGDWVMQATSELMHDEEEGVPFVYVRWLSEIEFKEAHNG